MSRRIIWRLLVGYGGTVLVAGAAGGLLDQLLGGPVFSFLAGLLLAVPGTVFTMWWANK